MTTYSAPLRDISFVLHELLNIGQFCHTAPFEAATPTVVDAILKAAARLCEQVLLPINRSGDEEGCHFENKVVRTPSGFREAYRTFAEGGWTSLACDPAFGGQGLPEVVNFAVAEMACSSNLAFYTYPALSHAAYNLIGTHGSDEIKCAFLPRLVDGRWTPTFASAKYILGRTEYAACEVGGSAVFHENLLPIMEAGQVVLVETDFALDDEVWLTPAPGHTAGHVAVNIASRGQKAVMIGDMMHSPIQLAHPEWSPRFDFDRSLSADTRKQFLDSHCETDTLVLTAHFPSPSVGRVVAHAERAFDFEYR